jgi:hypothetical protein
MKDSRLSFVVFAISLLTLSSIAFHSKSPVIFYRFDGTYQLMITATKKTWSLGTWSFTSNPLQGIGGLELPQHSLLEPGGWLAAYLPASIGPTAAMVFYATVVAVAICWLSLRLGMAALPTISAAWLGLLLAMPYVYPSLGLDFLSSVPTYTVLIFLDIAVIILLLDLGRGPLAADAARLFGIVVLCFYELILFPNFGPVSLIVLAFFGIVTFLVASSRRERIVKFAGAVALACLSGAVFAPLVFGLYGFAKPTFFWYEFYARTVTLRDLSFFIADHSQWPAWLAYGVSLAGAIHAAIRGTATIRPVARGFVAFVALNLLLIVLTYSGGWKGPRIAYIDIFAYPFYCLFAVHAVIAAASKLRLPNLIPTPIAALRQRSFAPIALVCGLPWLVLIDYWPPPLARPLARNENPFIWPPAETPVTKFLAGEVALRPGSTFRGRVVNVAGSDFDPQYVSAPFINQHIYDGMSLFFSGNDHRANGLWYFDIPTLFEANQFSSPFFHLVNARLLNASGARDMRSYETQSVVNERVMALLGARYLLSDKLLPDRTPVLQYRLVEGRDLYVYSIPAANLAGYAVTQTRRAANAQEAIVLLADPSLDPRTVAVLHTAEELPPLVPVLTSSLVAERGGYRIEAASSGTSLLVLPVEYSHCLRTRLTGAAGAPPPRLLRANLAMAAVLFTGNVQGRLLLRYGPWSSGCRIEDWREADAIRIGDAREWPAAR